LNVGWLLADGLRALTGARRTDADRTYDSFVVGVSHGVVSLLLEWARAKIPLPYLAPLARADAWKSAVGGVLGCCSVYELASHPLRHLSTAPTPAPALSAKPIGPCDPMARMIVHGWGESPGGAKVGGKAQRGWVGVRCRAWWRASYPWDPPR